MFDSILFQITAVVTLGILSQWVAWRFRLPAIIITSLIGLVAGPFLNLLDPQESLGPLYGPLISIAVAVVLFEGSLNLDMKKMKDSRHAIFRISTFGSLIAWFVGAIVAYFLAGLSLEASFIISGLFIITGPTVIIPLLRQAKIKERPATILKWEGIIVDPVGVLLALFSLKIVLWMSEMITTTALLLFFGASVLSTLIGVVVGYMLGKFLEQGYIPEFLKSPIVLVSALLVFVLSDEMMHETGLLAVTAMGIIMANMDLTSLKDLLHFKENISVLMISAVFIILTASLSIDTLIGLLNWPMLAFVIAMLFLVRPLSVWLSTIGLGLTKQERLFIGWIAPRGIISLTVSGFFASELAHFGFQNTEAITALTLSLIFTTVIAHGLSIRWVAKKLELQSGDDGGLLIVGGSAFSAVLAHAIQSFNKPVLIVDRSWEALSSARSLGIAAEVGDILSEQFEYHADLTPYEVLVASTYDDAYNALICQRFIPELGREQTFQTALPQHYPREYSKGIGGKKLFEEGYDIHKLNRLIEEGYTIRKTPLTEQYTFDDYLKDDRHKTIPLFAVDKGQHLTFLTGEQKGPFDAGTTIVSLTSPTRMMTKAIEKATGGESRTKD
ncbi:sodium:proton antiporter [Lysinibacillus yapensis]|uniref:Sodium:proton antiporter n=1 Tax=Ureibacillus yapensis TaxID=2304605 RepID=A0A396SM32_9BACL|nr:sodium:proton antiporter [Lysinibacillus yapensis]RHW40107.1 sodium:proton antiporter [Lysinibacillus yapensis]